MKSGLRLTSGLGHQETVYLTTPGLPESATSGRLLVALSPVPRVLSEERNEQENETCEEAGKKHYVEFETTVLHGVEGNRRESEYPNYSANDSNERRDSLLLVQGFCLGDEGLI